MINGSSRALNFETLFSGALQSHLVLSNPGPTAIYSAPREMLQMTGLVAALDVPMTKRRRLEDTLPTFVA